VAVGWGDRGTGTIAQQSSDIGNVGLDALSLGFEPLEGGGKNFGGQCL
jgi:hypothetical protein